MVAMDKGASRRISKNHFMGIGALPRKLSGVLYVIFGKPACDCTTIGRDDVHRIAPPERAFHPRRACGGQALAPGERESGRASGRERVCQSVSLSVRRVLIKTKKQQKTK